METDLSAEDEHTHEENVALFHLLSYLTKKTKKGTYIQAPKGAEEDGTLLRKDLLTVMNSNFGSQKHEWHNNKLVIRKTKGIDLVLWILRSSFGEK